MKSDDGSTIPLVLGFVMIALLMVAGSVAAGDAYVQQRDLQSVCDAAAVFAASRADPDAQRARAEASALSLANAQSAVGEYLDRDQERAQVQAAATLSADGSTVLVRCARRQSLVFGRLFGFADGIGHRATAAARAPISG